MGENFIRALRMLIKGAVVGALIWLMFEALAPDVSKEIAMAVSTLAGSAITALFRDMREEHRNEDRRQNG